MCPVRVGGSAVLSAHQFIIVTGSVCVLISTVLLHCLDFLLFINACLQQRLADQVNPCLINM